MHRNRFSYGSLILPLVLTLLISCSDSSGITESETAYHIPKNTQLTLSLQVPLSSNANKRGDTFKTILLKPLKSGESVVLPQNTVVSGLVKSVSKYKKFGDKASLVLIFDQIVLSNGAKLPIVASLDTRSGSVPIKIDGKEPIQTKMILSTAVMGALMENPTDVKSIGEDGLLLGAMIGTGAVLLSSAKEVRLPIGVEITTKLDSALLIPKH